MAEGQRPLSVGFWFSLGHSTIVFALGTLVVVGVRGLSGAVEDDGSALHQATGLIGPLVSGSFLLLIGMLNLVILVSIAGDPPAHAPGRLRRGGAGGRSSTTAACMTRFYARATGAVRKPWHMYPLGCLFGLGFDTATEVALLVLAGAGAAGGLPFYAILCLPILFAAGMSLFDTIDGVFMNFAYGWAFSQAGAQDLLQPHDHRACRSPSRCCVGGIELLAVLAERLSLSGGLWDVVTGIDLNLSATLIVGLFVATWALALAVWRFGRIEERWSAELRADPVHRHRPPLEFRDIDDVARALREAGGRFSAARRRVLEALFAADAPLAADRRGAPPGSTAPRSTARSSTSRSSASSATSTSATARACTR